jgi:hypothetical protein
MTGHSKMSQNAGPRPAHYGTGSYVRPERVAHMERVLRNRLRLAESVVWWEAVVEALTHAERWECWDSVKGRWRRYWRRNGSLPKWAAP